jgi:RNA polymerase sigma-70 factor, ECF subfamily
MMDRLAVFNQYRSLLFSIAYQMLGTISDAEDMLQEAWIRWQSSQTVVQSPQAFLSSLMTRLCIDHLRSAKVKRETYIGTWLPEPLIEPQSLDCAELAESLSFAFLALLECLSPTERAVFLLREVFDYDYAEIATTVGKSEANCRQIARRAKQHLILRRPNSDDLQPIGGHRSPHPQTELVEQFLQSWNQGDVAGLMNLMAEDITFVSDGGGQVTAAIRPLCGAQKVARFLVAVRRSRLIPTIVPQITQINQQQGIVNMLDEKAHSTFCFEIAGDRIRAILAVVNPEKLR